MQKKQSLKNELEISLFTLWSLFILIDQHFETLCTYRDILDQEHDITTDKGIYLDTINEAIIFQIFLKSCSFIDEWDKVFGVKTEAMYAEDIRQIKTIAKPARKLVDLWKGLREYRNQAVAHNHRDKEGINIYVTKKQFHIPDGLAEIGLLIYCIEKMAKIAAVFFYDEFQRLATRDGGYGGRKYELLSKRDILSKIAEVELKVKEGFLKSKHKNVESVSSIYADFLTSTY